MKNLIVNLGPNGDIVRTTVLLRELEGEVYWLTKSKYSELLKSDKISEKFFVDEENSLSKLKEMSFDLVVSLNEEKEALEIVKDIKKDRLVGVFLNEENQIDYTSESKYWFDMSLSSKLGKERADELKKKNKISYLQILIEMIGKEWGGQEYDLGIEPNDNSDKIGIIDIVTGLWPNKSWNGYKELSEKLRLDRENVEFLQIRPSIMGHVEDINNCKVIICGDTFGLHVALALKKKVVALFNCTSPGEIYEYERLKKVISPLLDKYFYDKENHEEAKQAISVEEVYSAVKEVLKDD